MTLDIVLKYTFYSPNGSKSIGGVIVISNVVYAQTTKRPQEMSKGYRVV